MTVFDINLDGDNAWPELKDEGFLPAELYGVAVLPNGTVEGRPAVVVRVTLPDGRTALAQTTLRLFQVAAAAIRGRYGED